MLNLLVAFPYFTPSVAAWLREHRDEVRLIVDSGAFTAHSSGTPISLDAYCRFLDSIKDIKPQVVQLDVIGDARATAENFYAMRQAGFAVEPVFTQGAPEHYLEPMWGEGDTLFLGGLVGRRDSPAFLHWIEQRRRGRKVHWLGCTDVNNIKRWKPTSVDSSSWITAAATGGVQLYAGAGRLVSLTRRGFLSCREEPKIQHALALTRVRREDEDRLSNDPQCWLTRRLSGKITAKAATARARSVERVLSTRVFFAVGSPRDCSLLLKLHKEFS